MDKTRIGFIGLGLIGGSIARAIRKFHPEYELLAYSHTRSTLDEAAFSEADHQFPLCSDGCGQREG